MHSIPQMWVPNISLSFKTPCPQGVVVVDIFMRGNRPLTQYSKASWTLNTPTTFKHLVTAYNLSKWNPSLTRSVKEHQKIFVLWPFFLSNTMSLVIWSHSHEVDIEDRESFQRANYISSQPLRSQLTPKYL